jgi:diguanylate cyclase (GGDEF)-like protein
VAEGTLLLAALLLLAAAFRPLTGHAHWATRVAYPMLLAVGLGVSALLAGLKQRRWPEQVAFYGFLLLGFDALGQFLGPDSWPVWPLIALLVAAVATAEPARVGIAIAGVASLLALADAKLTGRWQAGAAAALAYPALAALLGRALAGDRQRLDRALTEVARMRHGIDQFEEWGEEPKATDLSQVSEEKRRARRLDHDSSAARSLETIVSLTRRAVDAHSVVYFAVDRDRDLAFLKAAAGPEAILPDAAIPLGTDPIAFVLDRRTSFYATDYDRLLQNLPYYRGSVRIGTLLAVPVSSADVVVGVLVADQLEVQAFTGREPDLLEEFTALLAESLSQSRAAVSREERTVELGALANVSAQLAEQVERRSVYRLLLRAAHDLVAFESAAILRTDEAETRYALEAASGWARDFKGREVALTERTWGAWVLRSAQEPYLLDDLAGAEQRMPILALDEGGGRAQSLLAVPLRSSNTNLGALMLMGRRGTFDATANRVLKILANQAAAVLRTIWLVEQRTELAVRDGLTGLYNRRSFSDLLSRAIAREERQSGRFALMMLDIDHFKKLNDTHGHPAGDEALRVAAHIIEANLRRGDIAARYGGEEFVAILPGADEQGGVAQAERVRRALEAQPVAFEGARLTITASFGVAVWPEGGEGAGALVEAADRALYAAKQRGRNRVVAASTLGLVRSESDETAGTEP